MDHERRTLCTEEDARGAQKGLPGGKKNGKRRCKTGLESMKIVKIP